MPINTLFNPVSTQDFDKTKLNFKAQGVMANVSPGQTANLDIALTNDVLLTGAWVVTNNGNWGDTATFQVIDGTGQFTGVAGTVLNQFILNWYLPSQTADQFDIEYPAKILAGMTLRLVYTSTGTNSPFVAVNYKLHEVLV